MSTSRAKYHHGNLRDELLNAALVLVEDKGLHNLSMRQLARAVGVTHQAPYRHFADKSELVAALAERGFAALRDALSQAGEEHADPVARLDALGAAYVAFAVDNPALFRVMSGPEVADKSAWPSLRERAGEAAALLSDGVVRAERAGELHGDVPLPDVVLLCRVLAHGIAALALDGQLSRAPEAADPLKVLYRLSEMVRAGIGTRSDERGDERDERGAERDERGAERDVERAAS